MTLTQGSIDQYLNWLSANGGSPRTEKAYRTDLEMLLAHLAANHPNLATDDELELAVAGYLTDLRTRLAPTTIHRKLAAFRSWGKRSGRPAFLAGYRAPTPPAPEPHPLPEGIDGVLRMISCAGTPQHAAVVALCGLAGLRVSEACAVRPEDLDMADRILLVHGKGAKLRRVPLSDAAANAILPTLLAATPGEPIVGFGERRAREVITELGVSAKLSRRVASHDLRATFATAAYNKSLNLRAVQTLLGHANSKQTEVYTGVSVAQMRDAADVA